MLPVVGEMRVAGDVLHQKHAAGTERRVDPFEHARRARLVVNRVERRDQIVGALQPSSAVSACTSVTLRRSRAATSARPVGDRLGRHVDAGESAERECLCHRDHGGAAAAGDVERVMPVANLSVSPVRDGRMCCSRPSTTVCWLSSAITVVEPRIRAVGHAPAVTNRFDNRIFGAAEHRNPLRGHGNVVRARRARQARGMLRGQR